MATHPGVDIDVQAVSGDDYFQRLPQVMASSDAPDITVLNVVPGAHDTTVNEGLLVDLSDIWSSSGLDAAVSDAVNATFTAADENHYGIPMSQTSMPVIFVNADVFTELGLELPSDFGNRYPSVEAFLETIEVLKSAGYVPLSTPITDGNGLAFMLGSIVESTCGSAAFQDIIVNWRPGAEPTARWTDPCAVASIQQIADWADLGVFGESPATMASDPSEALFNTGASAMFSWGSWRFTNYDDPASDLDFDVDWMTLPTVSEPTKIFTFAADGLGVAANSSNIDLAKDFVSVFATADFQERIWPFLGVPGRGDTTAPSGTSPSLLAYLDTFDTMGTAPQLTGAVPYQSEIAPLLATLVAGERTASEVAQVLEDAATRARSGS